MAVPFKTLHQNYPTKPQAELFSDLGGQWPQLVNDPNYRNTCAIRLSMAFKASGIPIPPAYKEAIDGAGSPLMIKVATFGKFMRDRIGPSYWGISKQPGTAFGAADMPRVSGVCAYHVAWADASGHFDLWTGREFVGSGNFADIRDGFSVELWKFD